MRGPRPAETDIVTDPQALAHWTRDNLAGYWRRWWRHGSRLPHPTALACLTSWGPAWCVLGVSRLHYTLSTGEIISKTAAGEYARAAFEPRWHRIVDECLRIRGHDQRNSIYRDPFGRRIDALAFLDMVIDSGLTKAPAE